MKTREEISREYALRLVKVEPYHDSASTFFVEVGEDVVSVPGNENSTRQAAANLIDTLTRSHQAAIDEACTPAVASPVSAQRIEEIMTNDASWKAGSLSATWPREIEDRSDLLADRDYLERLVAFLVASGPEGEAFVRGHEEGRKQGIREALAACDSVPSRVRRADALACSDAIGALLDEETPSGEPHP